MKTLKECRDDVLTLIQREGDTDYGDKVDSFINLLLGTMYNQYDYWAETQDIHNFSTVADQEEYAMPLRFNKPLRVYDLTNDKKLKSYSEEVYFDSNVASIADADSETAPGVYRMFGVKAVQTPISTSGDTVQAKSSASEDVTVRVGGFIDSARTYIAYENISVTGTTATTAASALTFYEITHFSKSANTSGFITLENSSGTDLAILGQLDRVAQYKVMKLGKIPSQANSMRVLFKKKFDKLVNDNDYPFVDCDDYLVYGAASLSLQEEKEGAQRAQMFDQLSSRALSGILQNQYNKLGPDYQHKITPAFNQAHRA